MHRKNLFAMSYRIDESDGRASRYYINITWIFLVDVRIVLRGLARHRRNGFSKAVKILRSQINITYSKPVCSIITTVASSAWTTRQHEVIKRSARIIIVATTFSEEVWRNGIFTSFFASQFVVSSKVRSFHHRDWMILLSVGISYDSH